MTRTRTQAASSQLALARAVVSRPRCAPQELNEVRNAQFDLVEGHIRDLLRNGAEYALLRRLQRLLPEYFVVASSARAGGSHV